MIASDFQPGERVLYVPNHAHGDTAHPDCERGVVSSTNEENVFVRYVRKDGTLATTAQATYPHNLVRAGDDSMSAQHTPPPMRGTWTLIAPDGRKWEDDSPLRLAAAEQRERVPDQVAVQRVLDAASALRDRPKSLHELQDELFEYVEDDSKESHAYWLHCEIVSKQNRLFDTLETLVDALTSGAGRDFIEAFVRDASAALEDAQPGWNKVDEPTATEMRAKGRVRAAAPELLEALRPFANFACSPPGECDCHNCRARAAIAKAEGRTA